MAAGDTSASRVDLDRAGGGRFDTLQNYVDSKLVKVRYRASYTVTPGNADFALIPSTVVPGNIALGMGTAQGNGEILCEELPGAVGTALASVLTDEDGGYLNMVEVRDSATNDPIMTEAGADGRRVYGVLQAANGVADATAIGAAGAENMQVSFVYFDATDTLVLHAIDQEVQFGVPVVRMLRNRSPIALDEGVTMADIIGTDPAEQKRWHTRKINITANAGAGATIDIDAATLTGGNGLGTAALDAGYAEDVALGADQTEFLMRRVLINGRRVDSGDLTWVSPTSFTWNGELYLGDEVWVEEWKVPSAAAPAPTTQSVTLTLNDVAAFFAAGTPLTFDLATPTAGTSADRTDLRLGPDATTNAANVTYTATGVAGLAAGVWGAGNGQLNWISPTQFTIETVDIAGGMTITITTPYTA